MIKLGTLDISKLYLGNLEISKIYLGSLLVYTNAITQKLDTPVISLDTLNTDNLIIQEVDNAEVYDIYADGVLVETLGVMATQDGDVLNLLEARGTQTGNEVTLL